MIQIKTSRWTVPAVTQERESHTNPRLSGHCSGHCGSLARHESTKMLTVLSLVAKGSTGASTPPLWLAFANYRLLDTMTRVAVHRRQVLSAGERHQSVCRQGRGKNGTERRAGGRDRHLESRPKPTSFDLAGPTLVDCPRAGLPPSCWEPVAPRLSQGRLPLRSRLPRKAGGESAPAVWRSSRLERLR